MMVQIGVDRYINMNHVAVMEVEDCQVRLFMNNHLVRNPGSAAAVAQLWEIDSDDLPSQAEAQRFAEALARATWTDGSYPQPVDWGKRA